MNKMSVLRKRKETYVDIKIESGQSLNNREYELLRSRRSDYLLAADVSKKSIRYNITGYISLAEYFKSVTSKDRFLTAVSYMLEGISESRSLQLLELKRFVFDKRYIFVSRQDKRICFIYFPIINCDNGYDVKQFFNSLPYDTVFNQVEDCSYVTQYIQYFKTHMDFSLYEFDNFISELRGGAAPVPASASGRLLKTLTGRTQEHSKENNIYTPSFDRPIAHPSKLLTKISEGPNFCRNCGRELERDGAFCIYCGQKVEKEPVNKPKFSGTSVLGVQNYDDGTTVLSESELGIKFPRIVKISNNESIDINKSDYVIGQKSGNADYCVSENTAVSREHAHIITQGDKYYIIDYKSTNGTYVNNQRIQNNRMVEITDGTVFKLANEEFRFELQG